MFGPMKTDWDKILVDHGQTKMGKDPSHLQKGEFAGLLNKPANIKSGFRSTVMAMKTAQLTAPPPPSIFAPSVPMDVEEGGGDNIPHDLSMKRPAVTSPQPVAIQVKDIVSVFQESLKKRLEETPSTSTGAGTRLKHHTYGEVLTQGKVLTRLKEAEEKKELKRPATWAKRGRPKKELKRPATPTR